MKHLIFSILALLSSSLAWSLSLDTYATSSRLASGSWVKISVDQTGMYYISASQLRQWGFSNLDNVRIFGYGGARIPDELNAANYIDDLPMVPIYNDGSGLVFYGVGPENWTKGASLQINNSNVYSDLGYYFITDCGDELAEIPTQGLANTLDSQTSTYTYAQHYEYDRTSPGEAGWLLVGESFKSQSSRTFTFDCPVSSGKFECGIVSNSSFSSTVRFTVNGKEVSFLSSDNLSVTTSSSYLHGTLNQTYHNFDTELNNGKVVIGVTVTNASSMSDCWLDYLTINATAPIEIGTTGWLAFSSATPSVKLDPGSHSDIQVWDVTDPQSITQLNTGTKDGSIVWASDYSGTRKYVAWSASNATMLAPAYVGKVANQDIHAMATPDMVIFSPTAYLTQAQRIATLHSEAAQPLQVAVLDVEEVYNEFGSGVPDVGALRKCLKMFYDRSSESGDSLGNLRYALILARSTYDNRHLTSQFDGSSSHPTIPYWIGGERKTQLSDNTAYGTDDFLAMLEDGSGSNLGLDDLSIAVGRLPVRTVDEAKSNIDKLDKYINQSKTGTWKNHYLFLADDENDGVHVYQSEDIITGLLETPQSQAVVSKVYVDAYPLVAGSCDGGRSDMYRMLDEGVLWWNYCGHANNHSWTGENMLNYNDINNLYLTKVPVLLAATCDFLRWDSNTLSGGEIMHNESNGGTIATISATRPVYISDNGYFTKAVGKALALRDENGLMPRLGDIYRTAKNNILNSSDKKTSNPNRLRYVLMGDPAMQLQTPSNIVVLDSIGDQVVDPDDQVTLMALQRTTLSGRVINPQGEVLDDFDGTIEVTLYDAETSKSTYGTRDACPVINFEVHGDKLYAGSGKVNKGYFNIPISMPGEVADNFRPATLNMYANSDSAEAIGVNRDFFVYGYDESVPNDTVPPTIHTLYLNREDFAEGKTVNSTPMVIAEISDDVGINLSSAGIGHEMTITLDGKKTYSDVSLYYTPSDDGTPSGTINYPMSEIADGEHTITLRVWDTNANSASKSITFNVSAGIAPVVYDCYTKVSVASDEVNFYISHDRPDSEITVTVNVYTLMGREVWEGTTTGRAESFISAPVTWNLCDNSGRRVQRGIYVYRATVTEASGTSQTTVSRKLAITAPQ